MAAISKSFSLDARHIQIIEQYGEGPNLSLKLRFLLDKVEEMQNNIVIYDVRTFEHDDYTPVSAKSDAFPVLTIRGDDKEFGMDLPFKIAKNAHVPDLKIRLEDSGFKWQEFSDKNHDFYALWAAPIKTKSHECKWKDAIEAIKKYYEDRLI